MNKRRIKHHEKDHKELKDLDLYSERNLRLTITVQNKVFLRYDNKDINNRILIFASGTQLHCLIEATRIHGDGTFESCPNLFYQLYIITGYSEQTKKMMPCAWVLLYRKTFTIYNKMLERLKILAIESGSMLNPLHIMTDFEVAALKAFKKQFPKSELITK